jgi:hypothetical protein
MRAASPVTISTVLRALDAKGLGPARLLPGNAQILQLGDGTQARLRSYVAVHSPKLLTKVIDDSQAEDPNAKTRLSDMPVVFAYRRSPNKLSIFYVSDPEVIHREMAEHAREWLRTHAPSGRERTMRALNFWGSPEKIGHGYQVKFARYHLGDFEMRTGRHSSSIPHRRHINVIARGMYLAGVADGFTPEWEQTLTFLKGWLESVNARFDAEQFELACRDWPNRNQRRDLPFTAPAISASERGG